MEIRSRVDHDGRAVRMTADNSARGNSFGTAALSALADAMESAAADPRCAVVHLDMAGPNFCGGWDTRDFGDLASASADDVAAQLRASDEHLERLRALPVPIVAGVRGRVIGFGVGLLASIHLPIISRDASLLLPELRFGFAPAGVGFTVARLLPRAHAYALLTGQRTISGETAHEWGFAAQVADDDALDDAVSALVGELAQLSPRATRALVEVVESSRATGRPDAAYAASARTIVTPRVGETQ